MLKRLGVFYTGGSLNPARSLGPSVVLHSFYSYHWVCSIINTISEEDMLTR